MNKFTLTFYTSLVLLSASNLSYADNDNKAGASGFWGAFNNYNPKEVDNNAEDDDIAVHSAHPRAQLNKQGDKVWQGVIRDAVMYHPAIRSEIANLDLAGFNIDIASAGYLPSLSAGVTSGRQQEQGNGHIATVGLSQMLYDFGKTGAAVDEATAKYIQQKSGVLEQIDDIILQTAQALNEVHRYRQLVDIAQQQVIAVQKVYELTQMRADAGASSTIDPVQATARVKEAQAQAQSMTIKLQQQEDHLAFLLGHRLKAQEVSSPESMLSSALPADADVNLNPTLIKAQADLAVAQAGLRSAKAQNYPTVSVEVNSNRYIGDIANYQTRDSYNNVYLSVSGKLYQGGAIKAQENASASALAAAQTDVDKVRLNLADKQRSYLTSVEGLKSNIKILSGRLDTITKTRELYKLQYLSLGTRNVLDLLNAEQEISQSQQELVNARHDMWAANISYIVTLGSARQFFGLENSHVHGFTVDAVKPQGSTK